MTTYLQLKGFLPRPVSVKERKFNSRTQIWGLFLNLFVKNIYRFFNFLTEG